MVTKMKMFGFMQNASNASNSHSNAAATNPAKSKPWSTASSLK